jgi:hypothetical protein
VIAVWYMTCPLKSEVVDALRSGERLSCHTTIGMKIQHVSTSILLNDGRQR